MENKSQWGFIVGALIMLGVVIFPSPSQSMNHDSWVILGLMIVMALWWVLEVVPIAVTALLPPLLVPLAGVGEIKEISSSYAHPLLFLFMGGFILSLAMERSNLHQRIARLTMLVSGTRPAAQVGGMMGVTAFLSMWMSNTATTVMMLPIALSVIHLLKERSDIKELAPIMLLGIAYSASIGGMATLIGTPPNAFLAAYLSEHFSIELSFVVWMVFAVPLSTILLAVTWWWLTRKGLPQEGEAATQELFRRQLREMGPMVWAERWVLLILVTTALGWIFRKPLVAWTGIPLTDTGIALIAAVLLFLIPKEWGKAERLLDWESTQKLPWGVLVMLGGGLALAGLIQSSGLADYFGSLVQSSVHLDPFWILVITVLGIIFLTEINSNTATTAAFIPILGPVAVALGLAPVLYVVPVTIAASCAFMMPVATAPNAVVYGSGQIQMRDMLRAGWMLNLIAWVIVVTFGRWVVPFVFS
ncbi:MAG: SLC13 family permease [Verrucomicrobiota bacterium]